MKTVHYIGWYIDENEDEKYTGNVPAKLKMRYVADRIIKSGHQLKIFSLASKVCGGAYPKNYTNNGKYSIVYSGGITGDNKALKILDRIVKHFQFITYILFSVHKDDTIILYHSGSYSTLLSHIKKIVHRHVIIEVEEIYGYSAQYDNIKLVQNEFKAIRSMDAHILINDYLIDEIHLDRSKCGICYGSVIIPKRVLQRRNDGFIHVVYAGTIENRKMGALTAVEIARFLPQNYLIHILGFGNDKNIALLRNKINEINSQDNTIRVKYEGFLSGKELDDFLFSCHIGISTYVLKENFANNSLPSKIITYMCHDLAVVRGYASAYDGKPISKNWSFYKNDAIEDIAQAVVSAAIPEIGENNALLETYDKLFCTFLEENC